MGFCGVADTLGPSELLPALWELLAPRRTCMGSFVQRQAEQVQEESFPKPSLGPPLLCSCGQRCQCACWL